MKARNVQATPQAEAFHAEFFNTLAATAARYPEVKVHHIIAILSKSLGRMIGTCFPHERLAMLKTAELNIELGLREFLAQLEAQEAGDRAGPSPESKP